jgi:N-acetylglucosaminyl-diphospho-decaprenol L-rhamnosyltransferase
MSDGDPRVAVVIVSYHTSAEVDACLAALAGSNPGLATEIHVGDNGSDDGVLGMIEARYPEVAGHDLGDNLGFGRACNDLVTRTTAPWVLLLHPDTVPLPGVIDRLVEFAEANPEGGIYGGRTVTPDGEVEPSSCWGLPSVWSMTCFALGLTTVFRQHRILDPESLGSWARDTEREVGIVAGCLLLVRRSTWDELGGFDPIYFMFGEDADLCDRARQAGYRPMITPDAAVIHTVAAAPLKAGPRRVMVLRGKVTYFRRRWSAPGAWYGQRCLLVGVAVRALAEWFSARRGREPKAWIEAWQRRREWRAGWG